MDKIIFTGEKWRVPDNPVILYTDGDGIGPEIMDATRKVVDAAVKKAYKNKKIAWREVLVGDKALNLKGDRFPEESIKDIMEYRILLKAPLGTPVGTGFKSINVRIRQMLDLYSNIRPVKYVNGLQSPLEHPENVNLTIFRENTDDLYMGYEWKYDSREAQEIKAFFKEKLGIDLGDDTGIGLKPMNKYKTQRITRAAIKFAISENKKKVTIMHKGNVMKYTEGAFREWAYETALNEFSDYVSQDGSKKILINDIIADNMFQQIITRPGEYDVILAPNIDGDYISDAAGALIGNIGTLGGANVGDDGAMFEAVHGTAPKYAGKNIADPLGLIRGAQLMLKYMGWTEAEDIIERAVNKAIEEKTVTADLAKFFNVNPLGTAEYGQRLVENINSF
ncbi:MULTISPECIES: NADP-dependent isocitrate dehydrogenase [Acidiplasma]|jgi:isocitrate dehydrogenase|uniref:isocitrate dehydrogenase (NADP(+)) n=2 Tax=Acidiplasma TaxID=507753 RepID=A0A0Q0VRE3_9ARCH|nr:MULTISPECIES: NADP-dependent isocitrate dehydrogenase [Acidiplasma]KJE50030.1 isocitrate dehydrogenase [Acidiplasma sp. MBA-1]KPV46781.1 isocitrate dehydrogenase [Acidiplasma aeolicum]KQB36439.1 isocitrate dehydrogenase [Acidiplasma cupricumulans]WMT55242.1 MAG: NADP-dependent isocitrate dehydrogenase [Acidiplasma sp.]